MNLNDFVVLPKAKSLQFSARNPQGQQLETVTLAQQGNELEEKLQKLKESMRREKGERGQSGIFHWKSEQLASLNSCSMTQGTKKTQKQLSAGRVKIRVLKDEPVTAPPHLPLCETCCCPQTTTRQSKMKGSFCGQGDSRTDQQMFIRNYDEKTRAELTKKEPKDAKKDFDKSLLGGEYDEEESARSFQEALKEWRKQRCDNSIEPATIWTQTVSMSGKAAQTDFPPERGRIGAGSSVPVQVQFPERSLSYMDRLLLKRYRR